MLPLLYVQVLAALGIASTVVAGVFGPDRRSRSKEPIPVAASNPPARGTEVLWVGGTLLSVFWGVGVFVLPSYAYDWPTLPDFLGSSFVQIIGVGLAVLGGLLFWSAARALGNQMTPAIQVQQGHRLLQSGPYRLIRHPVYAAIMLVVIGQTLFFLCLPLAVLAVLLIGLASYRARLEESLLSSPAAFGETYRAYMARTGRFLPRLTSKS